MMIFKLLKFYFSAKTKYNIHSPFVFNFISEILEDKRHYYAFEIIEAIRSELLRDNTLIEMVDYGAGSHKLKKKRRRVKEIAKISASSPFFGQLLFKLALLYKPKNILEMGTSLGISSLYLASAAPKSRFISLEGCPQTAALAKKHFAKANIKNCTLLEGPFEKTLPYALEQFQSLDLAFIDGNHRKKPTLEYFNACLPYAHENTVLIFDDIHWSTEMEAAWEQIIQHPKVSLSVDLFFLGILFFRKEHKDKEHYKLIPSRFKPWSSGFFG